MFSKVIVFFVVMVLFLVSACLSSYDFVENVSVGQAYMLIQENKGNPDFVVLDVRTSGEYNAGHIEGAIMIDYNSGNFRSELDALERDKAYLLYCKLGMKSKGALKVMDELGFTKVYIMDDGITGWKKKGYQVVR